MDKPDLMRHIDTQAELIKSQYEEVQSRMEFPMLSYLVVMSL